MTTGKGYAPLGKSKTIATPDVNRNNKPVKTSGDKKTETLLQELVLLDPKNQ